MGQSFICGHICFSTFPWAPTPHDLFWYTIKYWNCPWVDLSRIVTIVCFITMTHLPSLPNTLWIFFFYNHWRISNPCSFIRWCSGYFYHVCYFAYGYEPIQWHIKRLGIGEKLYIYICLEEMCDLYLYVRGTLPPPPPYTFLDTPPALRQVDFTEPLPPGCLSCIFYERAWRPMAALEGFWRAVLQRACEGYSTARP